MVARELNQKEMEQVVKDIGDPVMKFMLRRIQRVLMTDEKYGNVSVNSFINAIVISMASYDANMLKWIDQFYYKNTSEKLDFEKLRMAFTRNLYAQLDVTLQ